MLRLPRSSNGETEVVIFGTNLTVYTRNQCYGSEPPKTHQRVFVEDGNHGNGGWEVHGLTFEEVVQLVDKHIKESK
jgi:hypothetical protein